MINRSSFSDHPKLCLVIKLSIYDNNYKHVRYIVNHG